MRKICLLVFFAVFTFFASSALAEENQDYCSWAEEWLGLCSPNGSGAVCNPGQIYLQASIWYCPDGTRNTFTMYFVCDSNGQWTELDDGTTTPDC